MDLGVDVVAVHRGELRKDVLRQFFERQPWASISALPTGEYLVLIDRGKSRT
jgi:peptidase E